MLFFMELKIFKNFIFLREDRLYDLYLVCSSNHFLIVNKNVCVFKTNFWAQIKANKKDYKSEAQKSN